jgi:membrane protein
MAHMLHGLRKPPIPTLELVRRTYREILQDDCLGMAAQLAYYFALALFPAMLVVVAIVSFLPWSVLDQLVAAVERVAPPAIYELVRTQLADLAAGNGGAVLTIGVLGALWTSSSALVSMCSTLNRAYQVTESRPWWKVRLISIGITIALAAFIVVGSVLMIGGPLIIDQIERITGYGSVAATVWSVLQYPVVLLLVSFGIAFVYYWAPDVEQDWVWITPGSLVACLLWLLASLGFRYYVSNFGNYNETYGTLAGAAILLFWMYLTGLAILVGGELNAEIEHALPQGKEPGERRPGQRRRLRAFMKRVSRSSFHDRTRPAAT